MSTAWYVRCVTCSDTMHRELGTGKSGIDRARSVIRQAQVLASLEFIEGSEEFWIGGRTVDMYWLKKHARHVLSPVNECGDLDGECARPVTCPHCGTDTSCRYQNGHEGKCAPGRK